MFGRRPLALQQDVDALTARLVGLDNTIMTALLRIGGLEMQHSQILQKINVMETRIDRELQRRRMQDEPDEICVAPP